MLGEYSGTPTIRLFTPKRKPRKAGNTAEKTVIDYQHGERKSGDLRKFLEAQLPNYVERIKFGTDDYDRLRTKAARFGLPLAIVFTTKATTSTTLKWLSAEFRRKMLVVEVPPTDANKGLRDQVFGDGDGSGEDTASALPALYVILPPRDAEHELEHPEIVRYPEGSKFARRNLQDFLGKHALSEPALEPIVGEGSKTTNEAPPPSQHDEF